MSVKSSSSISEYGEIVKTGYLKKLKTMRKKWFVLRAEMPESSARLEYYDNEKKFKNGQDPKRSISLKACFNINKRVDTKHKHVIALYTKDDCFCMVLENERDLEEWLNKLLSLQHGEEVVDGEPIKPIFEHVWQVTMLNKGLGCSRNILGAYHLCFTDKTLSLVRKSTSNHTGSASDHVEFSLMSVRRCGHSDCFFYLEVGRSAITGAGELWMQTEDTNIAQNMGEVILRAMSNNNNKEDLGPKPRIRSSSANEASKPISVQRRQTHSGQKSTSYCSPSQDPEPVVPDASTSGYANICTQQTHHPLTVLLQHQRPNQRRHSVSASCGAPWSGIAHHQRTQSLPLAGSSDNNINTNASQQRTHKRNNNQVNAATTVNRMGRDRCDSMPSRCRTTSESYASRVHLQPHRHSLASREPSHSPPHQATSPASASDSAGSSLSIEDTWTDYVYNNHGIDESVRYGHSLTPDEPIVEENVDEGADVVYNGASPINGYMPMAAVSSDDGYVDMSPRNRNEMSPAISSCSITSGTPSTDLRFSEYHLEKVSSYFPSEHEDDVDKNAERPLRAYSVGSRPDILKLKSKIDVAPNSESNSRVRAFSVGSRSKGVHNRVLPPHYHTTHQGGKSSSAPLLSNSSSNLGSSQSSMERMEDLMELDFSRKNEGYVDMSSPKTRPNPLGYVEMKPGVDPMNDSSTYLDMKPSIITTTTTTTSVSQDVVDHPYLDMRPLSLATSPLKPGSFPPSNYLEMKPGTSPNKSTITTTKFSPYMEMSGASKFGSSPKNQKTTSPIQEEYLEMDFKRPKPHDPIARNEGYMDMNYNNNNSNKHQRKSSLDSQKVQMADDYMNMSGNTRKKERKNSKKEKNRSQPITIQQNSFTSFLQNRKNTPPKNLPLQSCSYSPSSSPFSSLRRPRSRKNSQNSRRDSITTPGTEIFPFSPGSPVKNFPKTPESSSRKIPVDATSGTVKISGKPPLDYQKMSFDFSNNKMGDYTEMNFERSDKSDYVNFNPQKKENTNNFNDDGEYAFMKPIQIPVRKISAPNITKQFNSLNIKPCVFKPIVEPLESNRFRAISPKVADTAPHKSFENLPQETAEYETLRINKLSRPHSVTEKTEKCEKINKNHMGSVGSLTAIDKTLSRPNSVSSELGSTSSTLVGDSRPESVCSDQIKTDKVELHYTILDLPEETTKSPKNGGKESPQSSNSSVNVNNDENVAFTYAEIDFVKSESFKNKKVAH